MGSLRLILPFSTLWGWLIKKPIFCFSLKKFDFVKPTVNELVIIGLEPLMYELAAYVNENKETNLHKIHFYAFGGMKKTSEWLNNLETSKFKYNNKKLFEPE